VRAKLFVPNLVTLANIALGFFGMIEAARGRFERACLLVFFAALCDLSDGFLARRLEAASAFGKELDSLSDVVSFGLAPALLVYLAVLERLGWAGAAVAVVYALCGALRLARYNVDEKALGQVTFEGVPIPIAAGYMLTFVLCRDHIPLWLVALGTAGIAASMVSTVKIPKFRRGGLPVAMLAIGLLTFIVFLARPNALTWHLWNGWNLVMVAANYAMLARRGHLRTPEDLRRAA